MAARLVNVSIAFSSLFRDYLVILLRLFLLLSDDFNFYDVEGPYERHERGVYN